MVPSAEQADPRSFGVSARLTSSTGARLNPAQPAPRPAGGQLCPNRGRSYFLRVFFVRVPTCSYVRVTWLRAREKFVALPPLSFTPAILCTCDSDAARGRTGGDRVLRTHFQATRHRRPLPFSRTACSFSLAFFNRPLFFLSQSSALLAVTPPKRKPPWPGLERPTCSRSPKGIGRNRTP